ncbi:MAG: Glu-tRNA(Gln) amidotransferase subunit GatE [Methanoregulaceae archaeon]|jgi:glutamyl-tRNA(Gln) amidotransferase subunit E|nr:Glu-tRNA(Gln) amidotransferase subunit GatE [Methanoregulaceae archaeon]
MDYEKIGLLAGIEIHQQLDTKEKLFCRCPTLLRKTEEHSGEYHRYLRATESEMGEIDDAAREEMKSERKFTYYTYDSTCLVENDEEPPAPLNQEALVLSLTIAKMFGMTPIEQVNTMRKLVIDGSNTSGFQRTALIAINGTLPNGGKIETLCLEEEAAQRVEGETFSLDRLGIPLVEITTSPCMHTPEEVREMAGYLGMVLRSTGKVKRGLGTIRQDVNISIKGGARIEVKGVQELDLVADVVKREAERQQNLIMIRDKLVSRRASVQPDPVDVTGLFAGTGSAILKKAKKILAVRLDGFSGLVGYEIQPGRRLGTEMSDYAKKCGVGGIFHTDELPAYGITTEEVNALHRSLGTTENDCIVLVAATPKQAQCAALQVVKRARLALDGVPEETRKMLPEGNTAYMRPLPGAARMYPETDVLPVIVGESVWDIIALPELLTARARRFSTELGLDDGMARQIAFSERLPLFERSVSEGINPTLAARTILGTLKEIQRDGADVSMIPDDRFIEVLHEVESGKAAKEAIPEILKMIAKGTGTQEAIKKCAPSVSREQLHAIITKIVDERAAFVKQKGNAALAPLMGVVMAEVRGSSDGKVVSELLRKEIERVCNS